ncbi:hypothetical protein D3C84_690320 [compost metagenome]
MIGTVALGRPTHLHTRHLAQRLGDAGGAGFFELFLGQAVTGTRKLMQGGFTHVAQPVTHHFQRGQRFHRRRHRKRLEHQSVTGLNSVGVSGSRQQTIQRLAQGQLAMQSRRSLILELAGREQDNQTRLLGDFGDGTRQRLGRQIQRQWLLQLHRNLCPGLDRDATEYGGIERPPAECAQESILQRLCVRDLSRPHRMRVFHC